MKDEIIRMMLENVLHKGDEGRNRKKKRENVLHKGDERQNSEKKRENVLHKRDEGRYRE